MSNYILMKKNDPVLTFSKTGNSITEIKNINSVMLLPIGVYKNDWVDAQSLQKWIEHKTIAPDRKKAGELMQKYGLGGRLDFYIMNNGLSLNDCFWICPEGKAMPRWEDINFFNNDYGNEMGDYLFFGKECDFKPSPDMTTSGIMDKAWRKKGKLDILFKKGSAPYYQEPYNEAIASLIAKCFGGIKAVDYHVTDVSGVPASICKNFIKQEFEFVPAYLLYHKDDDIYGDIFYALIDSAKQYGMNIKPFLNDLVLFDYLIGNKDRHLGNIGFLKRSDSWEFIGPAPVFDSGSSLFFDNNEIQISEYSSNENCRTSAQKQLINVKDFDRVDFDTLANACDIIYPTLKDVYPSERIDLIIQGYYKNLREIIATREIRTKEKHTFHTTGIINMIPESQSSQDIQKKNTGGAKYKNMKNAKQKKEVKLEIME